MPIIEVCQLLRCPSVQKATFWPVPNISCQLSRGANYWGVKWNPNIPRFLQVYGVLCMNSTFLARDSSLYSLLSIFFLYLEEPPLWSTFAMILMIEKVRKQTHNQLDHGPTTNTGHKRTAQFLIWCYVCIIKGYVNMHVVGLSTLCCSKNKESRWVQLSRGHII